MNCVWDIRSLRVRHITVILAMLAVIGLPFMGAQHALFGPSNRLLSLVATHFRLSADTLTGVLMAAYCLLLGAALFASHRFLTRFMEPKYG